MLTKDHLALGRFLLANAGHPALLAHAQAFLAGCVEPDYNYLSYLRGFARYKKLHGHNAENAAAYIKKHITRFQQKGIHSGWDYFVLGTVLHYIADGFTQPHNSLWREGLIAHVAYERRLHGLFIRELKARPPESDKSEASPVMTCLANARKGYFSEGQSMEKDCRYIIQTCEKTFGNCMCLATPSTNNVKKEFSYEGAYNHRLVRTGH